MRALPLLLVGVASLAVGCGSTAVTNTAVVAPVSTNNALPLSLAEHNFVAAVETARPQVDIEAHTLLGYGTAACTAAGSGGTAAAVEAVRSAASVDDVTARAIVAAATTHLCPGTAAADTTTPTTTTSTRVAAGAGAGAAAPRRVVAVPRTTVTRTPSASASATATTTTTTTTTPTTTRTTTSESGSAYYKNCDAARDAGVAPLHRGDPGYRSKLDSDGNGVACEA